MEVQPAATTSWVGTAPPSAKWRSITEAQMAVVLLELHRRTVSVQAVRSREVITAMEARVPSVACQALQTVVRRRHTTVRADVAEPGIASVVIAGNPITMVWIVARHRPFTPVLRNV